MRAQRVKIDLPNIELLVDGKQIAHLESGTVDVEGIRDLRKAIAEMISKFGPRLMTDVVSEALSNSAPMMTDRKSVV